MPIKLSIIVAICGQSRGLGKDGKIPWYIPQDLKRFKQITLGHPIIMGRRTYQSIGKALPGRTNIVITQDQNFQAEGCIIAHSLEEALQQACSECNRTAQGNNEVFIIGGGQIYQQALPLAQKLYLTVVKGEFEADTFFPDYSDFKTIISKQTQQSGEYEYTFYELER